VYGIVRLSLSAVQLMQRPSHSPASVCRTSAMIHQTGPKHHAVSNEFFGESRGCVKLLVQKVWRICSRAEHFSANAQAFSSHRRQNYDWHVRCDSQTVRDAAWLTDMLGRFEHLSLRAEMKSRRVRSIPYALAILAPLLTLLLRLMLRPIFGLDAAPSTFLPARISGSNSATIRVAGRAWVVRLVRRPHRIHDP
jgi:hypothetical protein